MKKTIIFLVALFALSKVNAQSKEAKPEMDTVHIFSIKEGAQLKSILMQSNIMLNGKPATAAEVMDIVNWINSKAVLVPKQAKEQPKN